LPSPDEGPEAMAVRELMLARIETALAELPREQREVFVAQELEGASFKELAGKWNVGVNTLLSRKRYAILHLRERLQAAYDEWLED
jgi:DNA-directed RNA polymerase specialized sigma24 family protein